MMIMQKLKLILIFVLCLFCACADHNEKTDVSDTQNAASGEVSITFDYEKISGSASNQFAIWIEDMKGNYITTLYATSYTADGGYKRRPESLALWASKSKLASMKESQVDAISGATPEEGTLTYIWDLTGADGNIVQSGEYRFFVEGALRWQNYVLYSGIIELGSTPAVVQADVEFFYEGNERAALTSDSRENSMIGAVTASFILVD